MFDKGNEGKGERKLRRDTSVEVSKGEAAERKCALSLNNAGQVRTWAGESRPGVQETAGGGRKRESR